MTVFHHTPDQHHFGDAHAAHSSVMQPVFSLFEAMREGVHRHLWPKQAKQYVLPYSLEQLAELGFTVEEMARLADPDHPTRYLRELSFEFKFQKGPKPTGKSKSVMDVWRS